MENTLYDLLEVNQSASQDAISASYKRLKLKFEEVAASGDEDATNQLVALREAFSTLSNLARRKRYDEKLALNQSVTEFSDTQPRSLMKPLLIAVVIAIGGVTYMKFQAEKEQARLETERLIAATKAAELEAIKEREEREALERKAAKERAERERDLAYGTLVSRSNQRAEADIRWQQQREEQQRAYDDRQKQYEADRQLAREKAYLRKIEAENHR